MSTVLVGTVCSGTMRIQDMLPLFLGELANLDPKYFMDAKYGNAFKIPDNEDAGWWETDEAMYMLEEVMELLDYHAPEGYYFGPHFRDGADYGWWELDEG